MTAKTKATILWKSVAAECYQLVAIGNSVENKKRKLKKKPQEINQLKELMCSIGLINKTILIMVKIVAET